MQGWGREITNRDWASDVTQGPVQDVPVLYARHAPFRTRHMKKGKGGSDVTATQPSKAMAFQRVNRIDGILFVTAPGHTIQFGRKRGKKEELLRGEEREENV